MSNGIAEVRRPPDYAALMAPGIGERVKQLRLNATLIAGAALLLLIVLGALAAPLLTPYNPIAQNYAESFLPPFSPGHVFGTDNFGRDVWARIVYSMQLDLQIGVFSVAFPFFFGSLIGVL